MPNWDVYFSGYSLEALVVLGILHILIITLAILVVMLIYKFVKKRLQRYYHCWKDRRWLRRMRKDWKKREEIYLQENRKKELHRKEREKYPLFYWKEKI